MSAVYVPQNFVDSVVGKKKLIPLQTAYLIPVSSSRIGMLLAALLNSLPFRVQMTAFAERARGAYFRHFSWTVGLGFIPTVLLDQLNPKFVARNKSDVRDLVRLSSALHRSVDEGAVQELDCAVSREYGLSVEQQNVLNSYLEFMCSAAPLSAPLFEESGDTELAT
jgi:hypothetical protein